MARRISTPDGRQWAVTVRWRTNRSLTRRLLDRIPIAGYWVIIAVVTIPTVALVLDTLTFLGSMIGHAVGLPWVVEAASGDLRHAVRVRGWRPAQAVADDMLEALRRGERLGYPQVM